MTPTLRSGPSDTEYVVVARQDVALWRAATQCESPLPWHPAVPLLTVQRKDETVRQYHDRHAKAYRLLSGDRGGVPTP